MKTKTKKKKPDFFQELTDKIIERMQKGHIPWRQLHGNNRKPGLPRNVVSGHVYNGINILNLWMSDSDSNDWATYRQWESIGAQVKKGEKGSKIVFFTRIDTGEKTIFGQDVKAPVPRWSTVFHASQCENVDPNKFAKFPPPPVPNEACEAFVSTLPARILHIDEADVTPGYNHSDYIQMPCFERYGTGEDYYRVLFHELVHWTGAKHRLNRTLKGTDKDYAYEELVAELGAAFLCHFHGFEYDDNHTAYLQSWLSELQNDKKYLMKAAGAAKKAFQFLMKEGQQTLKKAS